MGINVENLKEKLKCANDNSYVVLVLTEKTLEMNISSPKRKRTIKRTLFSINFEKQDVPMDALNSIVYPYTFEMTKDDFVDLINNVGFYSEILSIKTTEDCVLFSESSKEGSSEIDYKKKTLVSLSFNEQDLLAELEREDREISKEEIEKVLKEKICVGSYSLTFLKVVKIFSAILDANDKITFSIKTDTPLKVELIFKRLNKTRLTYYLAPRVSESDFDDDDFDDEEEEISSENQEDIDRSQT